MKTDWSKNDLYNGIPVKLDVSAVDRIPFCQLNAYDAFMFQTASNSTSVLENLHNTVLYADRNSTWTNSGMVNFIMMTKFISSDNME